MSKFRSKNQEIVEHIMYAYGVVGELFIMEALLSKARDVERTEYTAYGLVSPETWKAIAKAILEMNEAMKSK